MGFKIGEYISEELSDYINIWTDKDDFKKVAKEHDRSSETIRAVLRQDLKFTQVNIPLIIDVLRIAIENRNTGHGKLNKSHKQAEKIIKQNNSVT